MATKKKTTARTTGLTGNQFASVEQGRSYVLSVNSPTGAGEIELLAADSDQQFEPDMFSMLREKIETARQIPFVAISPFVFVNVGSSDVQWLVTPANFSIAVPGASSGGGSSFDPEAPQEISGDWQFTGELIRTVKASPAANDVLNKAMGDNLYMTLDTEQEVQGAKNFEGNIKIRTIQSDITYKEPTVKVVIWTFLCNNGNMVIYQYTTTSLVGLQSADTGGGFNVAKNGQATCENSLLVKGGTTINSLSATGPATFDNTVTVTAGNKILSSVIAQDDLTETTVAPVGSNDARYIQFKSMTKAEYNALETKSNSTIYFLTDQNMWAIGDKELVTSDMPA